MMKNKKKLKDVFRPVYYEFRRFYHIFSYIFNYNKCNPKFNIEDITKVVFVAHPDDELIFLGNTLMNEDGWLVVCMTNGGNRTRRKEFINVMNTLNIDYKIFNYKDGLDILWDEKKLKKSIHKILNLKEKWDKVVTHNRQGEYGHFQHKQLNKIVRECYKGRNINVFVYKDKLVNSCNKLSLINKNKKLEIAYKYYLSQIAVINNLIDYFDYEGLIIEN